MRSVDKARAYAIVRFKVVHIMQDFAKAEADAKRLNAQAPSGVHYSVQTTKLDEPHQGREGQMVSEAETAPGLGVWRDDEDWVIAESAEDVLLVLREFYGGNDPADFDVSAWRRLPDDKMLVIRDDDGGREEKTCAEWAKQGRGYLGGLSW